MRVGLTEERFPFLARLSATGRRELDACAAARVKPRQIVLQRGDSVDGAYLIVDGSLRVYYITAEGREATLYQVEPGGTCVLALGATFRGEPYPAWVEAGSAGGAFVRVPNRSFRRLLDEEAAFRDFVFGALSGRIFELMQTLEEVGSAVMQQRVARFLARRRDADGAVRARQIDIASELGTAREVVFRALRSLAARGLIETRRARIQILDPGGLTELARTSDGEEAGRAR